MNTIERVRYWNYASTYNYEIYEACDAVTVGLI